MANSDRKEKKILQVPEKILAELIREDVCYVKEQQTVTKRFKRDYNEGMIAEQMSKKLECLTCIWTAEVQLRLGLEDK